ncbi:SDR family NAD(P)-dependent oxidoreductase [Lichenifustis flavocetrariae]|uniref:SDR family NAD(P)-dependent oxidoreductase n=1 Tax=Lichenifustis flavocetrariae TaxID=2949735 RepID=UPI003D0C7727
MHVLVALTYAFAPEMVAAWRGGVINLASTAAFQPLAGATLYAASKASSCFSPRGLPLIWRRPA